MQDVVPAYTILMSGIVDTHAPRKTKLVKIVSKAPGFDEEYKSRRKLRRRAEKRYKDTGLQIHKDDFISLRKQTIVLAFNKNKTYYKTKINECNDNSKMLFRCVNRLLDVKQNVVLPCHNSSMELAENLRSSWKR